MKNQVIRPLLMASFGLLALTACQKDTVSVQESTDSETITTEGYYTSTPVKSLKATYHGMDVELLQLTNGKFLYDGDIVLERTDFTLPGEPVTNGVYSGGTWGSRTVYWKYAPGVSQALKDRWTGAIAAWKNDLNFQFKAATNNTPDYIEVQENSDRSAYSSSIGKKGGKQVISLDPAYFGTGNMIHEIGHAVGLIHEQKRPDRDQYIIVNYSNIKDDWKSQYNKCSSCTANGTFDFGSIMLYGAKASSDIVLNTSIPAMTKLDGTTWTAQRTKLSTGDKAAIEAKY